ncbi:type VI secretion system baseplate subunit TssK [Luteimonas sp. BDR2-5]|uniref:type VI secretion system baseplate subunit TssK n=1 Tax=Proluteimonas luteida TaxID=2878685 RepID=UPI001E58BEB0|nr:type VI secretion system baseplate subunit TssK [Luteimonas sp. BDR2-5]MCD9027874.1 type VI secretion system baseplate subunit TssK [Luteimonas sp. BDR2-5]
MTQNNKIVWSEGLFLRPQHMQQHERYLERCIELRAGSLRGQGWGFTELELEPDLLAVGRIGLRRARGVFPDGTPFSMPDDDPLPPPFEVDAGCRDVVVHLTLPLRSAARPDSAWPDAPADRLVRFHVRETEAVDVSGSVEGSVVLEVGGLATRLLPDSRPSEGLVCMPLVRVVECRADNRVVLDDAFIPTTLDTRAAPRLATFLVELLGLLHQRGEALAGRVAATDRGGAAEIADFLLLQAVNRWQPLVAHWAEAATPHPEALFRALASLAGELATFTAPGKRPPAFPPYRHEDQRAAFEPVVASLRGSLSAVLEQTAVAIPIQQRKYGVWVAVAGDATLFDNAAFVLAARADQPAEALRRQLPAVAKIGPVEKIRDLVNLQLPGVGLAPMPVAPRQIPYHAGHVYFELDRQAPLWRELRGAGGVALHFGNDTPGLELQLWAIRG